MSNEKNANIILGLAQIVDNSQAFRYSKIGRLNLPRSEKEALDYVGDVRHLMTVSDGMRSSFSGLWFTADLFDMPEKYADRDAVSVAHAQLEITKNDLRSLLATVDFYQRQYRELAEKVEILENILFSLNSVQIADSQKIHMSSMRSPFL